MACASQIINELNSGKSLPSDRNKKLPFKEAVNSAFCFVVNYIKEHFRELRIDLDAALGDLRYMNEGELIQKLHSLPANKIGDFGNYFLSVEQNFNLLALGVMSYRPDESLAADQSSMLKTPK